MSRALEYLRTEVADVVREVREQSGLLLEASDHVHDSASETAATMQQLGQCSRRNRRWRVFSGRR